MGVVSWGDEVTIGDEVSIIDFFGAYSVELGSSVAYPFDGGAASNVQNATWNPADKGAAITLSGSNRVATAAAGDNSQLVRSVTGYATGDKYFEVVATHVAFPGTTMGVGMCKAGSTVNEFVGQSTNGYGWLGPGSTPDGGAYFNNVINRNPRYNYTNGDILGWYYKASTGEIWLRKNGAWVDGNGDAGTGATFTGVAAATWHMACTPFRNANAFTIPATLTYALPAGASSWN